MIHLLHQRIKTSTVHYHIDAPFYVTHRVRKRTKKRTSYSKPKYPIVAFLSPILDMVTWQALYQPFSPLLHKNTNQIHVDERDKRHVKNQDPEPGYRMLCIEREKATSVLLSREPQRCGLKLRSWRRASSMICKKHVSMMLRS